MSYQDLVKQYIDSCGSIYDFIRASEDYERRISLTDLLETRLYACEDELNPEETAYNADDELTWVSPWGINFEGKQFSLQNFTPEQFVAFGAHHPCLSQYALYLHRGESFEPEALTIEERALKGRSADEWRVLYHGHEFERIWNDCDDDGDWLAEKVYYQGRELKELEDKASAVERQKGYWYDD